VLLDLAYGLRLAPVLEKICEWGGNIKRAKTKTKRMA